MIEDVPFAAVVMRSKAGCGVLVGEEIEEQRLISWMKYAARISRRMQVFGDAWRIRRIIEVATDKQIDAGIAIVHALESAVDHVAILGAVLPMGIADARRPVGSQDDQIVAVHLDMAFQDAETRTVQTRTVALDGKSRDDGRSDVPARVQVLHQDA